MLTEKNTRYGSCFQKHKIYQWQCIWNSKSYTFKQMLINYLASCLSANSHELFSKTFKSF